MPAFHEVQNLDELDAVDQRPRRTNHPVAARVNTTNAPGAGGAGYAEGKARHNVPDAELEDENDEEEEIFADDMVSDKDNIIKKSVRDDLKSGDFDKISKRHSLKKYIPYLFLGGMIGFFSIVVGMNMGDLSQKTQTLIQPPVQQLPIQPMPERSPQYPLQGEMRSPFAESNQSTGSEPSLPSPPAGNDVSTIMVQPHPMVPPVVGAPVPTASAAINANADRLHETQAQIDRLAQADREIIGRLDVMSQSLGTLQMAIGDTSNAIQSLAAGIASIETRLGTLEKSGTRQRSRQEVAGSQSQTIPPQPGSAQVAPISGPQADVVAEVGVVYASSPGGIPAVNLRTAPASGSPVIGQAKAGDKLIVTGRIGTWLRVNHNGGEAFIAASMVSKAPFQTGAVRQEWASEARISRSETGGIGAIAVQSAMPGRAWICQPKLGKDARGCNEGSVREIRIGDQIPTMGYVVDIRPDLTGRTWEVITEKGIVPPVRM
jgi:Bacterial SH3 domain